MADLKFNTKSVDKIVSKVGNKRANDTDSNTPTKRAKTSETVTSPIDMSTLEDDFLDTRSNMSSPDSVEHAHDIVEHEEHASDTEYSKSTVYYLNCTIEQWNFKHISVSVLELRCWTIFHNGQNSLSHIFLKFSK